jgi:hypothetical protein
MIRIITEATLLTKMDHLCHHVVLRFELTISPLFTADDQAPDADEASLLIAIIED